MSADVEFEDSPFDGDEVRSSGSLLRYWDWMLAGSLAWLLFEMFAQPAVSIVAASLKFGWTDFANGFWLWRRDPLSARGRTCGMFYTAAGFWRITVTTLLLLLVAGVTIGVINSIQRPAGQRPPAGVDDAVLAGISALVISFCFVLSALTTLTATLMALRLKLKIWLDPRVRECRRFSEWPPRPRGDNQISRVVTTSLVFLSMVLLSVSFAVAAQFGGRGARGQGFPWLMLVPTAGIFGAAGLILGGRDWVLKRISASAPPACWPDQLRPGCADYSAQTE